MLRGNLGVVGEGTIEVVLVEVNGGPVIAHNSSVDLPGSIKMDACLILLPILERHT